MGWSEWKNLSVEFTNFIFKTDLSTTQTITELSEGDLIVVTGGTPLNSYKNMKPSSISGGVLLKYLDTGGDYTRCTFIIKATSSTVSFTKNSNMTHYNSICVLKQ